MFKKYKYKKVKIFDAVTFLYIFFGFYIYEYS